MTLGEGVGGGLGNFPSFYFFKLRGRPLPVIPNMRAAPLLKTVPRNFFFISLKLKSREGRLRMIQIRMTNINIDN